MLRKVIVIILFIFSNANLGNAEVPIATDSRIKTYVYNPNDVYLVLITSGFQTSIEFQDGEVINTLSLGDQYSWSLTPLGNRLFIKPMEENVRTNMTVITNLRTYQFDVASKSEDETAADIAYVIRFYYPPKIKV